MEHHDKLWVTKKSGESDEGFECAAIDNSETSDWFDSKSGAIPVLTYHRLGHENGKLKQTNEGGNMVLVMSLKTAA